MNVLESFKQIKLFVIDVDGVLTDGKLWLIDLELVRSMNIKDGFAIQLAVQKGYHIMIISGAKDTGAVENRLKGLGVRDINMGIKEKAFLLNQRIVEKGYNKNEVLYIGDDIPDTKAMQLAGVCCCPNDAASEIKLLAHYISPLKGGEGCVRDIIEKVLKLNHNWDLETNTVSK
jgi:3-deoxy-D-manno-octulosonate 8-phosphate phosphatase (KDO 8-P phosphatase)